MISDEEYQERIQDLNNKEFKNLYFIHIPKAAGSYIKQFPIKWGQSHEQFHSFSPVVGPWGTTVPEELLLPKSDPQLLLEKGEIISGYKKIEPTQISKKFLKFATIRNPFDYLVSCYFSKMVGVEYVNLDGWPLKKVSTGDIEEFLISFSKSERMYLQSRKNLFHQIFDNEGRCCVDVLIRVERIDEGLSLLNKEVFSNKLNISKKDHKNITGEREINGKRQGYKKFYTSKTKKEIKKKIKRELGMFEYNFKGPTNKRPLVFLDRNKKYDIFKDFK